MIKLTNDYMCKQETMCTDFTNVTLVSDDINWKCFIKINVHTLPVTSHQGLLNKFVLGTDRDDNG